MKEVGTELISTFMDFLPCDPIFITGGSVPR